MPTAPSASKSPAKSAFDVRHLRLLQEAQRIARIGSWERDLKTNQLWWSDECYRLFDFAPGSVHPTYNLFLQQVHPEDRENVREAIADSLVDSSAFGIDFRVLLPRGQIRHYHMQGRVFTDGRKEPVRTSGTVQDVTDRHSAEQRLLLADKIFAHSPIAIVIADQHGAVLSTNPAFTQITHVMQEQATELTLASLPLIHTPAEYAQILDTLNQEGRWAGERNCQRPSGEMLPVWLEITRIFEGNHHIHSQELWIFSDITERKRAEERFNYLAYHDALTGLPNRLSLLSRLEQALPEAHRYRWSLAVIFIDLDRFKTINDTLGHQTGDQLLMTVANRLTRCVRASDTVARLGGDEFVIVLPDAGNMADIAQVASKILDAFQESIEIDGHELHSSPSLGIAVYPTDGADTDTLMKNADTAMYHAKAAGRNTYQFYVEEMNLEAINRMKLEHKLRQAAAKGQFSLHYQPQFNTENQHPIGVEALLRWSTPEDGMIGPNEFIPVAEETGLVIGIGNWVLREACQQLQAWRQAGLPDLTVAVNVSARQLLQRGFLDAVESALKDSGLPPALLELEITESVLMNDPKEAIATLDQLRDMGVSLAIDDFGTGFSSLSYLKLLPIHQLKIDRSFVADLEYDLNDRAIAFGTIALAHSLGLKVVAEGVETEDQLELLRVNGCDNVQGYLFSRPLNANAAFDFLKERLAPT